MSGVTNDAREAAQGQVCVGCGLVHGAPLSGRLRDPEGQRRVAPGVGVCGVSTEDPARLRARGECRRHAGQRRVGILRRDVCAPVRALRRGQEGK